MDEIVLLLLMTCILIFIIIIFPQLGFHKQETCKSIPISKMDISDNTLKVYAKSVKPHAEVPIQVKKTVNNDLTNMDPINANIMLDSFYISASETVPENYPLKNIGECPDSKRQSTDLPLANVSVCGINKGKPMKLSQY